MKNISVIGFITLQLLAITMKASATDNIEIKHVSSTLTCGDATLTAKTTFLYNKDASDDQVLTQSLLWESVKTNDRKEIKTDGKYVIKHMPEARKVLDAAIGSLSCIKSNTGDYFFKIYYYCTFGEERGFCAQGRVEFIRYLGEDGTLLFKSPRHWKLKRDEEALYRNLGILGGNRAESIKNIHPGESDN